MGNRIIKEVYAAALQLINSVGLKKRSSIG